MPSVITPMQHRRRDRGDEDLPVGCYLVLLILLFLMLLGGCLIQNGNEADVTITVKEKQAVATHDSYKYLIFSTQDEVFESDDTFVHGKWNSSDIYGKLEPGHTYKIHVCGTRIPLFSMYRSILSVDQEVK